MYTKEETKYLTENYKNFTNKELSIKLNKSERSISRKLSRLGLKKTWSKEELEFLNSNYHLFTNEELSKKLNRSVNAILSKANKLKLSKDLNLINNRKRRKKLSKFKYQCKICKDFGSDSLRGLSIHLSKIHKEINHKDYYIKYIGNIKKCYFCDNDGKFIDLENGFRDLCESNVCLSKSRNTQDISFLLRKGYNEEESFDILSEMNLNRSEKVINNIQKNLKINKNYSKEKSPNCKEFYIKRGYSEEESIIKSSEVVLNMQLVSHKNRKENPEKYLHTYTTKIEYYLNKGYNEEESKWLLRERQRTFSKKICIEKYGKEKGVKVWLDRQEKWHKSYKKSNFSKVSQELFQEIWKNIKDIISYKVYFATLDKNDNIDISGSNYEYRLRLEDSYILPDFYIPSLNKIIEFDGTYYHRNNIENKKREEKRDKDILNNNIQLLHISESDYRKNKDEVIQRCINFLNL